MNFKQSIEGVYSPRDKIMIKFHQVTKDASIPTRGTDGSAGFDLYANSMHVLAPCDRVVVNTGIITEFDPNLSGQIWPRSGMAAMHGIDVLAGVVDSDYRGEVKVCLINHGDQDFHIMAGDRIAQILFVPVITVTVEPGYLSETDRGQGGFGSTGR